MAQLALQALSPFRYVVRWFDSWAQSRHMEKGGRQGKRIDVLRTLPFVLMHVACLSVIWVGVSPVAVIVAIALYYLRMFALTGFYHRYFSHRSFKTSRVGQFVFALWGASAVQRGPLWWAAHHRHHHRFSDEPEDLHSPTQHGFLRSQMTWVMDFRSQPTQVEYVKDFLKYPELVFLDRFDTLVPILLAGFTYGLGALLEAVAPGLGTNGWQMFVWGFLISTVVLFHCTGTINSLSHMFGKRPYATTDTSRNNVFLALLTMGEGWHNNHHRYMNATRQGFKWWQVDLTWYGLLLLRRLGLIWDMKGVPPAILEEGYPSSAKHEAPQAS